ncbi:carboxymuconolactone decarboxylase family protein [Frankia sp. AgB1.9]|uniref:carboxymuconolactone decarboxylase family protein n=1 Tax=unclassified Frankia TaxID=2632575 RepID=UPI001933605C|nr:MULTISPECIES: carboxymuconolactone decarboxylase family protein [unclassified Frankia]MBL7493347.1 carboxymuconolactone decarboxylase family protein [Frankia sp. AgW1.1]MBL7552892.1 carboxymuconolactone decarboxylase family protein [Frankia sp. AgB1.9]MBL7621081.1 carboxymuconolactone decarboxylase family protein [Frankia sp. AgB1.8]
MARIEPLPLKQWPKEMRQVLAALEPPGTPARLSPEGRSKALNTLGVYAHHTTLAQAFFTFNGHILSTSTLSDRQRELIVLRVAAQRKAGYEWLQHTFIARDAGLSDEEIQRIALGPDAPLWDPLDAATLRAVDELIADGKIGDGTWAVLVEKLEVKQILDVIFTVGAYETLAYMISSFDIEIDDDMREAVARRQSPTA